MPPAAGLSRVVNWPLVQIPTNRHTTTGTCVLGQRLIGPNAAIYKHYFRRERFISPASQFCHFRSPPRKVFVNFRGVCRAKDAGKTWRRHHERREDAPRRRGATAFSNHAAHLADAIHAAALEKLDKISADILIRPPAPHPAPAWPSPSAVVAPCQANGAPAVSTEFRRAVGEIVEASPCVDLRLRRVDKSRGDGFGMAVVRERSLCGERRRAGRLARTAAARK